MLMMFTLMAVGFILRKLSALPENSHTTMSKPETFLFVLRVKEQHTDNGWCALVIVKK